MRKDMSDIKSTLATLINNEADGLDEEKGSPEKKGSAETVLWS